MKRVRSTKLPKACQERSPLNDFSGRLDLKTIIPLSVKLTHRFVKLRCAEASCGLLPCQCRRNLYITKARAGQFGRLRNRARIRSLPGSAKKRLSHALASK